MTRAKPEVLEGGYIVLDMTGLRATAESDPTKYALWKLIWECTSFEQLNKRAPAEVFTRTNRRITWQSEVKWALKRNWIKKVEPPC